MNVGILWGEKIQFTKRLVVVGGGKI